MRDEHWIKSVIDAMLLVVGLAVLAAAAAWLAAFGRRDRKPWEAWFVILLMAIFAEASEAQSLDGLTADSYGVIVWHPSDKTFTMDENCSWHAWGKVLGNGRVLVLWTNRDDGRICPAIYSPQAGTVMILDGQWGYPHNAWVACDWSGMIGTSYSDRLYLRPVKIAAKP